MGHWGARWLVSQPQSVGVDMAFDPDEFVTLTDHGRMKLRSAVSRAMTLPLKERRRATIVRASEPAILNFKQIKILAAQWAERLVPAD